MQNSLIRRPKFALFCVSLAFTPILPRLAAQNTSDSPIPERFEPLLDRYDLDRYDLDRNGRISAAEKKAMPQRLQTRIEQRWQVRANPTALQVPATPARALPGATSTARVPDAAMLELARQYHQAMGGQTFLVMHQGKVIHESYANGGSAANAQMLASGSKSFIGVTAAAAVQDGLIRLDDAASESLTEWRGDALKKSITYRQLLSLTSGLLPGEKGASMNSIAWRDIIAKPLKGKPGAQFDYGPYQFQAFGEALQRKLRAKSGETFEAYLKRRILDPIGIRVQWRIRCADGNPQLAGGAFVTARDWAKFGEWMRLGGQHNGRQIVDAALLQAGLVGSKPNPAYGLTWWLNEPVSAAQLQNIPQLRSEVSAILTSKWMPQDLYFAAGAGKQRLYVAPSLQLTIVRQAPLRSNREFDDAELLSRLLRGQPKS